MNEIKRFLGEDTGATMVEYALMVALIALACIVAVTGVGHAIATFLGEATTNMSTAGG